MRTPSLAANAPRILAVAALAGVTGDLLLRGGIWRAGFALWVLGLLAAVLALKGRCCTEYKLMLAGVALAAAGTVLRDSPMLYALDMLSVLCMGILTIWHGTGRSIAELSIVDTVRAGVLAVVNMLGGAFGVVASSESLPAARGPGRATLRAVLTGAVLAIVPLAIVTALLASSDKVFDSFLERIFTTVVTDGLAHAAAMVVLAWLATGWLRATLGDPIGRAIPDPRSPALPFLSIAVVLYALLALLVAFVGTQARVLFGGAEFLRQTANLSVASYAREGFFQLILAAGVVLGTLVVAEWLLTDDDAPARRHYRIVSAVLLALIAMLLVSSATRIWLYVDVFGLSVDRAFASAAIVWLCAVLCAFAFTTLRERASRFMAATIVVTAAWVAMMNIVNPEQIVVRVNVARAAAGQSFDARYHARLSADALPLLVAGADRLTPADCQLLHAELRTWWAKRLANPDEGGRDWRSSDLPLSRARRWYESSSSAAPCTAVAMPAP